MQKFVGFGVPDVRPAWTVTEHMDGTPMYIAPENRLRIW